MLLWLGLLIGVNSGHGIDLHNSKCLDPVVDHGNTGSGGSSATVVEGLQNAEVDQVLHDAVSLAARIQKSCSTNRLTSGQSTQPVLPGSAELCN
jgi:hypothetical protein